MDSMPSVWRYGAKYTVINPLGKLQVHRPDFTTVIWKVKRSEPADLLYQRTA